MLDFFGVDSRGAVGAVGAGEEAVGEGLDVSGLFRLRGTARHNCCWQVWPLCCVRCDCDDGDVVLGMEDCEQQPMEQLWQLIVIVDLYWPLLAGL